MATVIYGLEIGRESSGGPVYPSEAEAVREGQAFANSRRIDVTVFRLEVAGDSGVGEFTDVKELRVLRPQPNVP